MSLQLVTNVADDLRPDSITGIFGSKVWYVHDGRNAWHRTWVERYTDGCLHLGLREAQLYCEGLRTRGSVFCIQERPSIRIETATGVLVVTEVSTKRPLACYSPVAVDSATPEDLAFFGVDGPAPLRIGESLTSLAMSFRTAAPFWREPLPKDDTIVLAWVQRSKLISIYTRGDGQSEVLDRREPELLDNSPMYGYRSNSVGGNYLLAWNKRQSKVSQAGVLSVLSRAGHAVSVSHLDPARGEA